MKSTQYFFCYCASNFCVHSANIAKTGFFCVRVLRTKCYVSNMDAIQRIDSIKKGWMEWFVLESEWFLVGHRKWAEGQHTRGTKDVLYSNHVWTNVGWKSFFFVFCLTSYTRTHRAFHCHQFTACNTSRCLMLYEKKTGRKTRIGKIFSFACLHSNFHISFTWLKPLLCSRCTFSEHVFFVLHCPLWSDLQCIWWAERFFHFANFNFPSNTNTMVLLTRRKHNRRAIWVLCARYMHESFDR